MKKQEFIIESPYGGFGDALCAARLVAILVDNGINAVYKGYAAGLVDVPKYDENKHKSYLKFTDMHSYFNSIIPSFKKKFSITKHIKNTRLFVPVIYYDIPSIKPVDVSLCLLSGSWSAYRGWPYGKYLKLLLDNLGITYVDLNEIKARDVACLNWVKKSKLYIGVDTGVSQYVGAVAAGKTILLGGPTPLQDIYFYDFEATTASNVACINGCLRRNYTMCTNNWACMKNISVGKIVSKIIKKLGIQKTNTTAGLVNKTTNKNTKSKLLVFDCCGFSPTNFFNFDNFLVVPYNGKTIESYKNNDVIIISGLINKQITTDIQNYNKNVICWGTIGIDTPLHKFSTKANQNKVFNTLLRRSLLCSVTYTYKFSKSECINWVPCASCMSKEFDKQQTTKYSVVVYEHKKYPIKIPSLPKIVDGYKDFKTVIEFLASSQIVLTNNYFGMYWATLLGKKVVVFPTSTLFYNQKHQPSFCYKVNEWEQTAEKAKCYPNALCECREANKQFYNAVLALILQ